MSDDMYSYDPTEEEGLGYDTPSGNVESSIQVAEAHVGGCLHPHRRSFRLLILVGACVLTFGAYFSQDVPGAVGTKKMSEFYDVSTTGYSLLYSVYALPNMVLPLIGGMLIDRYLGPKFGGILFAGVVVLGQAIFSLGTLFPTSGGYYVGLFGRFVFGLGGENLAVTQSTYCAKWFAGKELATAFSITLSFARFGSAINFLLIPSVVNTFSISFATWIATGCCVGSFIAAVYLAGLDWKGDSQIAKKDDDDDDVELIRLKDVLKFGPLYWYLTMIVVFFYISVFVFVQYSAGFFEYQYGKSDTEAGNLNSVIYLTSAIFSPFVGYAIDRIGYPLYFLIGATGTYSLMMLVMMALPFVPPIIPMFLCGLSYTVVASSLWPTVPLVVKPHEVGTAYGIAFSIQNFGQVVAPAFLSLFVNADNGPDFLYAIFGFAVTAGLSSALAMSMLATDLTMGRTVNVSTARKKELLEQKELEEAAAAQEDIDARKRIVSATSYTSGTEDEEFPEVISTLDVRRKRNSKTMY